MYVFNLLIYFNPFCFLFSVEASVVLQQANKGLVSLRHYVESHNGRISDEVNLSFNLRLIDFFFVKKGSST